MVSRRRKHGKTRSASCNKIVFKGNDAARDFLQYKEILAESALAYATVAKLRAEFTQQRSSSNNWHQCG